MPLIQDLLEEIKTNATQARSVDIRIGGHWTSVATTLNGTLRGGLASTLGGGHDTHQSNGRMPVRDAGQLLAYTTKDLAALALSDSLLEMSVGFATINALLDVDLDRCVQVNAGDVIVEKGTDKNVAIIGHFPFTPRVRKFAKQLWVLELRPQEGDLPASKTPEILPQADVIAITGTSLLNHTFEGLMKYCNPKAFVIVLGATTPLSPRLFDEGVDAIAGTTLVNPTKAMYAVSQGATFRQIPGKRLLTMFKE